MGRHGVGRRLHILGWAASGGQSIVIANPACSTGSVEWTLGLAPQVRPFQHQEAPAIKWMLRDPVKHAWGPSLPG
jgi:hypothetical protein